MFICYAIHSACVYVCDDQCAVSSTFYWLSFQYQAKITHSTNSNPWQWKFNRISSCLYAISSLLLRCSSEIYQIRNESIHEQNSIINTDKRTLAYIYKPKHSIRFGVLRAIFKSTWIRMAQHVIIYWLDR